jgi:hypothetical protein
VSEPHSDVSPDLVDMLEAFADECALINPDGSFNHQVCARIRDAMVEAKASDAALVVEFTAPAVIDRLVDRLFLRGRGRV